MIPMFFLMTGVYFAVQNYLPGGPVQEIRPGDTVWIPPNEVHWHGASPGNSMCHIAMQEAQGHRVLVGNDFIDNIVEIRQGRAFAVHFPKFRIAFKQDILTLFVFFQAKRTAANDF